MNHATILDHLAAHLPTLPFAVLSQLATYLLERLIITPSMSEADTRYHLNSLIEQLVTQAMNLNRIEQKGGDGAIIIAGNVVDSTLTTFILQTIHENPPFWFQIPPFAQEIDATHFSSLRPHDAAQVLFESMPCDRVPAVTTQRAPESRLPFRRQETFVGRATELLAIAQTLKDQSTAALVPAVASGILGIGKTSLAIEFTHRYGRYFAGGVFWLDCAEPTLLPAYIARCGGSQHLAVFRETDELSLDEQVGLVLRAWNEPIPRLLIFDNCEDPKLLQPYAPTAGGCRMLVTARHDQWGHFPVIRVGMLSRDESIALLHQLAPRLDAAEADQLAGFVNDLPLALHLAGSYLGHYQHSVAEYLATLTAIDPLTHRSFQGRGVRSADIEMPGRQEINLLKILTLAVEGVQSDGVVQVLSRTILDTLSHLAPGEPVYFEMIKLFCPDDTDSDDIIDAFDLIRRLGLIDTRSVERIQTHRLDYVELVKAPGNENIQIHRLVHGFIHSRFGTPAQQIEVEKTVSGFLQYLTSLDFPDDLFLLERHAVWLVERAMVRQDSVAATLAYNLAHVYMLVGRYEECESLIEQALLIVEQTADHDPESLFMTLDLKAMLYQSQGRYNEAEPLQKRAIALCERLNGSMHNDVADLLNHLGMLYSHQGRYNESEQVLLQAINIHELNNNHDTIDYFLSLNNISMIYLSQARFEDAESLLTRTVEGLKACLGDDHPRIMTPINNLGYIYLTLGRYTEAEIYIQRSLDLNEMIFGIEHPETVISRSNLAVLYFHQGRFQDSDVLIQRSLVDCERILGSKHPHLIKLLGIAGGISTQLRQYGDAEIFFVRALQICEQVMDQEHPAMAECLNNLGIFYEKIERLDDAETMLKRALVVAQTVFPSAHPLTAQIISNLGFIYLNQHRFSEAIDYNYQALAMRRTILPPQHPDVVQSLNNLAQSYGESGQAAEAIQLLNEALTILDGQPIPILINVLHNLAQIMWDEGHVIETIALYEHAMALALEMYGADNSLTATIIEQHQGLEESLPIGFAFTRALQGNPSVLDSIEEWYSEAVSNPDRCALAQAWKRLQAGEREPQRLLHDPEHPLNEFSRLIIHATLQAVADSRLLERLEAFVLKKHQLSSPILQALNAFLEAPTWEESRQILEQHYDVLLSDEALMLLQQAYTESIEADNQPMATTYQMHANLLLSCRDRGIEATFADVGK